MHLQKAALVVLIVLSSTVTAISASEQEAGDWLSGLKNIFQDYEDGKISYLNAWLELERLTRGTLDLADEDVEMLGLELVESKPFELYLEEETANDVIYINVDGKATKCRAAETFGSGVRRYSCDFTEKKYQKVIFDGYKSHANLTVQTELSFRMQGGNYEDVLFRKVNKAYLGGWSISKSGHPRRLVEESFPGFAKEICDKNEIIGRDTFAMLNRKIETASAMAVRENLNYSFRPINDSHYADNEKMECRVSIEESDWKEQKMYECGAFAKYADEYPAGAECKVRVMEGGVQKEYGCRDYKLYKQYKTEECQTEISAKIPSSKISFKVKMKKPFMENKFSEAWEKMKERPFGKPVKLDSEVAKKLETLEGQAGGLVTSIKIYNDTSSLMELTLYLEKNELAGVRPEFFEKSNIKIKIKSDALYNIYSKFIATEGGVPEPSDAEFKRAFLGGVGILIEIFKAGIAGDISVEPFWNAIKLRSTVEKLTAFQSCAGGFLKEADENKTTTVMEFARCYELLR